MRAVAILALAATAACGGRHHLGDYSFQDRSLAVRTSGAPSPRLATASAIEGDTDNPVEMVVVGSARVAKQVEARKARARLDSAEARVRVAERMAERTLERASLYLGARPAPGAEGDFILAIDIRSFGIDARHEPILYIEAEAILVDAATGREIWSEDVDSWDRLADLRLGVPGLPDDVFTAGTLATISVPEFAQLLEGLADYAADEVTDALRSDLRKVRR